jgi:hypothetical protein
MILVNLGMTFSRVGSAVLPGLLLVPAYAETPIRNPGKDRVFTYESLSGARRTFTCPTAGF